VRQHCQDAAGPATRGAGGDDEHAVVIPARVRLQQHGGGMDETLWCREGQGRRLGARFLGVGGDG
jgi:hypothetical protein